MEGITIDLYLNQEDYVQMMRLFEADNDPGFTIISQTANGDITSVRVFFENTVVMWGLAKRVEMHNTHNKRMQEIQQELEKRETK